MTLLLLGELDDQLPLDVLGELGEPLGAAHDLGERNRRGVAAHRGDGTAHRCGGASGRGREVLQESLELATADDEGVREHGLGLRGHLAVPEGDLDVGKGDSATGGREVGLQPLDLREGSVLLGLLLLDLLGGLLQFESRALEGLGVGRGGCLGELGVRGVGGGVELREHLLDQSCDRRFIHTVLGAVGGAFFHCHLVHRVTFGKRDPAHLCDGNLLGLDLGYGHERDFPDRERVLGDLVELRPRPGAYVRRDVGDLAVVERRRPLGGREVETAVEHLRGGLCDTMGRRLRLGQRDHAPKVARRRPVLVMFDRDRRREREEPTLDRGDSVLPTEPQLVGVRLLGVEVPFHPVGVDHTSRNKGDPPEAGVVAEVDRHGAEFETGGTHRGDNAPPTPVALALDPR